MAYIPGGGAAMSATACPYPTLAEPMAVVPNVGQIATLDEFGFQRVQSSRDTEEMKNYIRRLVATMGGSVNNEGSLSGFAPFFSGEKGAGTVEKLVQELSGADWVTRPQGQPSAPPPPQAAVASPLSEENYKAIQARRDTPAMAQFLQQLVQGMGGTVTDMGSLTGFATYFSGERASQPYQGALEELRRVPWCTGLTPPGVKTYLKHMSSRCLVHPRHGEAVPDDNSPVFLCRDYLEEACRFELQKPAGMGEYGHIVHVTSGKCLQPRTPFWSWSWSGETIPSDGTVLVLGKDRLATALFRINPEGYLEHQCGKIVHPVDKSRLFGRTTRLALSTEKPQGDGFKFYFTTDP